MKHLSSILFYIAAGLFLAATLAGCGCIVVFDSKNGRIAAIEFSVLKDVTAQRYATTEKGTTIEKGSGTVNDAAVQAITAGVVEGVLKGVK